MTFQVLVDGELRDATPEEIAELEALRASERQIVPAQVTMRQARLALFNAGKLANVDAAINSLPSPQKEVAQIEWEFSSTVERGRDITTSIATALGMSEQDLDNLFIEASKL
jgi:hypothetical protein